MLWIGIDLAVALLALVGLSLVVLRLWRQVRAFTRVTGDASTRIGDATAALEAVQVRDA